jgi:hypothetical protein
MRRTILVAAVALLAAGPGCNRGAAPEPSASDGVDRSQVWTVEGTRNDGVDLLVRGARVDSLKGDLEQIIKALNRVTTLTHGRKVAEDGPGPPVLWLREVRNGVALVEVADADYLTQKMGTTGAHYYLTEATYSLTEAPGVRAVNFMFEEGDHAAPGVYTRESFKDVEIVKR